MIECFFVRYYYNQYYINFVISSESSNIVQHESLPVQYLPQKSKLKSQPTEELDFDKIKIEERGYPQNTHLVDYATSAVKQEVQKHDRFLVQGMAYMSDLNLGPEWTLTSEHKASRKLCINIYICNRRVPYINALLMTLLAHDISHDLLNYAKINFINTEKRKSRIDFRYMREVLSQLPFVDEVHNVTYPDTIYEQVAKMRPLNFREQFISDQISGLKLCIESKLDWCLMIEEDAIVPTNFIKYLKKDVIKPIEKQGKKDSIGIISLYSYYNLVFFGDAKLIDPSYSKMHYGKDQTRTNSERKADGSLPYHAEFTLLEKEYKYGTVAMLYTLESAKKLVEYLEEVGVDPIHNADEFMNDPRYFPLFVGRPRRQVEPSMVNHIGFYSERMASINTRGVFSQLNTDARFIHDAGITDEDYGIGYTASNLTDVNSNIYYLLHGTS